MNNSTAKWLIGILSTIGFGTIALLYILDQNGSVTPLFETLFKPIVFISLFPVLLLLIGLLIARGKKEDKISNKTLSRSAVVIAALFVFRWLTGYFN